MELETIAAELLGSIRTQTDLITAVSTGGIGLIMLRIVGVDQHNIHLPQERRGLLGWSLAMFVIAAGLGFLISMSITGFWSEILTRDVDPKEHLKDNASLRIMSVFQILFGLVGMILISIYVACSVKGKTNG